MGRGLSVYEIGPTFRGSRPGPLANRDIVYRSNALKATTLFAARRICLALPLVCSGAALGLPTLNGTAEAGLPTPNGGSEVRGQSPGTVQEASAQELLKAARSKMESQQWVEADVLLKQAEEKWGLIRMPFGDSPAKARRDLERLRGAGPPQKPSERARPSLLDTMTGKKDPRAEARDPFAGGSANVEAVLDDKKPAAQEHLKNGRVALQQGNLAAAAFFAGKATELGVQFGPHEDSPQRLTADIEARGGQVANANGAGPAGPRRLPNPSEVDAAGGGIALLPQHQPAAGAYDLSAPPRYGKGPDAGLGQPASADSHAQRVNQLLLDARRALAVGDSQHAQRLAAEARALGAAGGPLDDSPTKIEALVRRHNEITARRAGRENSEAVNKMYAQLLLEQAEGLMRCKDFQNAQRLAADAMRLGARFEAFENDPGLVLKRIAEARGIDPSNVGASVQVNVGNAKIAGGARLDATAMAGQIDRYAARAAGYDAQPGPADQPVAAAVYDPLRDGTRNVMAAGEENEIAPAPPGSDGPSISAGPVAKEADSVRLLPMGANSPPPTDAATPPFESDEQQGQPAAAPQGTQAMQWIRQGDAAMRSNDRRAALDFYRKAMAQQDQLDPLTVRGLQDRMQLAQAGAAPVGNGANLLDDAGPAPGKLMQQMSAQMNVAVRRAEGIRGNDPRGALNQLKTAKAAVEQSALTPAEKKRLLARVDRSIGDMEKYIKQHRSEIDLAERNEAVQGEVDRQRAKRVQVQEKLALLVDEFNKLRDEQRFAEAEVIAKQAYEMAPEEPVATQLYREVRFWRNVANNQAREDNADNMNTAAWLDVDRAGVPMDASRPLQFGDVREWNLLTDRRRRFRGDAERRRSPKELEIEQKLRSPVALKFRETPLSEVIDRLKEITGVNIYLDQQGLAQEGVHPSTPVTIDLTQDIQLKSALNLILEPLHLGYVVRDEVLKITSEQHRSGNVYTKVYNAADLVIPIPDFVPHNRIGLPQIIDDGYNRTMANLYGAPGFQAPVAQLAAHAVAPNGLANQKDVLAQQTGGGITNGGIRGGNASADFDGLIDLIAKTVEPESWDEVGGPGSMKPSPANLSLVITQTQEVHERIADLLEQLRRLQDLQVTIEVRFITLSDNFFERIGVDFDFNIRDNATAADVRRAETGAKMVPSATLGLLPPTAGNPFPNFTSNGEIPYSNNSFDSAIPPFGGFNPASAATFGIAILSDLEAFFLVQAAQGDARTNVMQAPKVTLFNGQAASISDQSQTPFVTSVTPVVGDFAAAQAPVIVVLNEGTTLSVQAVVSQDRRFVRLTLIPFFSHIGDVTEFQFTGSTTTKRSASESQEGEDNTSESDTEETVREGTTVQLPTFVFTTVTTTVSVPDGGTVLLGGVKRLREGRNEFGVPIMSKIPYVNRLFKNVGIGREAQSLMMMVTPRIIIQEEEEEKLGLSIPEEEAATRRLDRR